MEAKLKMKHADYLSWLNAVLTRPGGEILAIQTLRNAIMAASVLASAALVAQMAVMASSGHMLKWVALSLVVLFSVCASLAVWAIVRFAAIGFGLHFVLVDTPKLAHHINRSIQIIKASAFLLMLALGFAALSVV